MPQWSQRPRRVRQLAQAGVLTTACILRRQSMSPLSDLGVPWLLTSSAVERLPVSFVKVARAELVLMRANRRRLESFVASDYPQAIKLLR
jgi:hypothetical protein